MSYSSEIGEELIEKLKVVATAADASTPSLIEVQEDKLPPRSEDNSAKKLSVQSFASFLLAIVIALSVSSLLLTNLSRSRVPIIRLPTMDQATMPVPIVEEGGLIVPVRGILPRPRVPDPSEPAVAAEPDVDFGPYMAQMQKTLRARWVSLPEEQRSAGGRVVVFFKIAESGRVYDVKIDRSTGDKDMDQAGLKAVEGLTLNPLPTGSPRVVDMQFTFEKNVLKPTGPVRR